jgi:nucleotide-binding universal stress UspA family protein
MFKRIAVALDGSDCAQEAFETALRLAKTSAAELRICSIVDPIVLNGSAPPSPAMDLVILDMENEASRLVDEAIARARREGVIACGWTHFGTPAHELLQYVQRCRADLIVMGTHGRKGLSHLFMGSVAEEVARHSPVPVLIVRATKRAQDASTAVLAEGSSRGRLL